MTQPTPQTLIAQILPLVQQLSAVLNQAAPTAWPRTDRLVAPLPPLPTLPAAGGVFTDPAFGSTILRVTDWNTQSGITSYRTPSEHLTRAWSSDGSHFYVVDTGGGVHVYAFDPVALTATPVTSVHFEAEPTWSIFNPTVLIGKYTDDTTSEAIVQSFDLTTGLYTRVVGTHDLVPTVDANGRTYLRGTETGSPDGVSEYLSFIFGGTSQDLDHYVAWGKLPSGPWTVIDTLADARLGIHAHACNGDQSGRYVLIGATGTDITAGKAPNYIWDTQTGTITPMANNAQGHTALGYGVCLNTPDNNTWAQTILRNLATPDTLVDLVSPLPLPAEWNVDNHMSWSNAQPNALLPVLMGTLRYGAAYTDNIQNEWEDEIIGIRTDVSQPLVVSRYAHHRSDCRSDLGPMQTAYWYTPRPNISRDGRFALFTSNWQKTLGNDPTAAASEGNSFRQDVFLVKLTQ